MALAVAEREGEGGTCLRLPSCLRCNDIAPRLSMQAAAGAADVVFLGSGVVAWKIQPAVHP